MHLFENLLAALRSQTPKDIFSAATNPQLLLDKIRRTIDLMSTPSAHEISIRMGNEYLKNLIESGYKASIQSLEVFGVQEVGVISTIEIGARNWGMRFNSGLKDQIPGIKSFEMDRSIDPDFFMPGVTSTVEGILNNGIRVHGNGQHPHPKPQDFKYRICVNKGSHGTKLRIERPNSQNLNRSGLLLGVAYGTSSDFIDRKKSDDEQFVDLLERDTNRINFFTGDYNNQFGFLSIDEIGRIRIHHLCLVQDNLPEVRESTGLPIDENKLTLASLLLSKLGMENTDSVLLEMNDLSKPTFFPKNSIPVHFQFGA